MKIFLTTVKYGTIPWIFVPITNVFKSAQYVSPTAKHNSHKDSGREGNRINKLYTKGFKMHQVRVWRGSLFPLFSSSWNNLSCCLVLFYLKHSDKSNNCSNPLFLLTLIYLSVNPSPSGHPGGSNITSSPKRTEHIGRPTSGLPTHSLEFQGKANFVLLVAASLIMYHTPCKWFALTDLSHEARTCTISFL